MSNSTPRRSPVVFRIAGAVLLIAAVAGQVWQRQPAGSATRALLGAAARHCPAAAHRTARPTVANGAHALDAWGFRAIADAVDPQSISRCAAPALRG